MSSSSTSPQPPPPPAAAAPPPRPPVDEYNNTNPYIHKVALGVTPVAFLALFLPPRRLDLRFLILGGVTVWGTNQLVHDYTGTSTLARLGRRLANVAGSELPERAKETQLRIRLEKAERARKLALEARQDAGVPEERRRLAEELERKRLEEERGLLTRVWMGDSPDDWKEKRDQREKEALSEGGGGYWGLIVDQISEVWSGGKKKDDGDKMAGTEKTHVEDGSKKS
ncbi:hypothetical protein F5B19DRAFT_433997 [Rostrohypoxylon terebratum]|nr:hypothetical protein F5B19DRAFT_433997 [Rostrohypoxylon terebratum]